VLDLDGNRFFVEGWRCSRKMEGIGTSIEISDFQVEFREEFYELHPQIITFLK